MAFVDEIQMHGAAGRGGNGVVRWLHIKGKEKGGPSGGDGGKGGDIVFVAVRDLAVLASYRYTKKFRAENGYAGEGNNKHGADGEDVLIKVPVGSVITLPPHEPHELLVEGERYVALKGGAGGFGNAHYKSSVNQNPMEASEGKKGEAGDIFITLKLIADAGLIGLPNAGKSSLLNALTRARSKVGAYPFTTLDPHLGDFYGHLLADIPGLIEGASSGRGLGSKFLRHIERTGLLVHLVSAEQENPKDAYASIRAELEAFGQGLQDKKELVVLSKTDLLPEDEISRIQDSFSKAIGKEVLLLSVIDDESIKRFSDRLSRELTDEKERGLR